MRSISQSKKKLPRGMQNNDIYLEHSCGKQVPGLSRMKTKTPLFVSLRPSSKNDENKWKMY